MSDLIVKLVNARSVLSISEHLHMHLCCSYSVTERSQVSDFPVALVKVLPPSKVEKILALLAGTPSMAGLH